MGITVADIEQKEFIRKGAGYDSYDVDSYLDQICDEMIEMQEYIDKLESELQQAKAEAKAANEAVRPMPQEVAKAEEEPAVQKVSGTLENILLSAQRISDEAVQNAKREAADIVSKAETQAADVLKNVKDEKSKMEKELKTMKVAAGNYKKRFLGLLEEHKALLTKADDLETEEETKEDA